jgi:hypothetical protein
MNNDTDKLRAELQAKMQTMTDELYSQLGISESMLSGGSCVSAEIHYATDVMDARIQGFLAGQQYESDMHRDMRYNYAKLQDKYNSSVSVIYELSMLLQNAIRDMRELMCVESICDMCACQCKEEEPLRSCKCFHWKYYNAAMDVLDLAKNIKCK